MPKVLEVTPIIAQLSKLRETIVKTLMKNDFPLDFIVEAKFMIVINQGENRLPQFTCKAILKDKVGRIYEGRTYIERAG